MNATIHLITHPYYSKNKPIIELIENTRKPLYRLINKFPYNENHIKIIKLRDVNNSKYYWDATNKSWCIEFNNEDDTEF